MEFITGLFLGTQLIKGILNVVFQDEDGRERTMPVKKGLYRRQELDSYKGRNVYIEYEYGDGDRYKIIRISIPTSTTNLDRL